MGSGRMRERAKSMRALVSSAGGEHGGLGKLARAGAGQVMREHERSGEMARAEESPGAAGGDEINEVFEGRETCPRVSGESMRIGRSQTDLTSEGPCIGVRFGVSHPMSRRMAVSFYAVAIALFGDSG